MSRGSSWAYYLMRRRVAPRLPSPEYPVELLRSNDRSGGSTRIGHANVPVAAHSPLYAHDPGAALARRFAQPRHFFWTTALSFDCLPGVQVHSSAWPSESYRDTQYHSRKSVHPWRRTLHKRAQSPPNVPYAPIEIADSRQGFFQNAGNRWSAERVMLSGDRIGRLRSPKPRGDVHAPIRGPSNDQGAAQYVGVTRDRIQISSSVGTC